MLRVAANFTRAALKPAVASRTVLPAASVASARGFATLKRGSGDADVVQRLYLDALKAYQPAADTEKPDLPERLSKPAAPAAPTLELSPAEPIEEGGEIVLVNPDDFAPYVDPIENPEDFDPWWDYTTDHDVYPHNLNRPPKPPTELHEAH